MRNPVKRKWSNVKRQHTRRMNKVGGQGLILLLPLVLIVSMCSNESNAHGGGLDSHGGHYNRSTGKYHCHRQTGPRCKKERKTSQPTTSRQYPTVTQATDDQVVKSLVSNYCTANYPGGFIELQKLRERRLAKGGNTENYNRAIAECRRILTQDYINTFQGLGADTERGVE